MAYATQAQLVQRFAWVQLATDDTAAGAIDSGIVTECIALADARIDAAVSQHYSLPLGLTETSTQQFLREIAGTLAGYLLAQRRNDMIALDALQPAYEQANEDLKRIADGKLALLGETLEAATHGSGPVVYGSDTQRITRANMLGW